MDINHNFKKAGYSLDALALHVKNSSNNNKEAVISARPRFANISELQLKNLTYLMQTELEKGRKVIVKNMQMKKHHFEDLYSKINCLQNNVEFLVSVVD